MNVVSLVHVVRQGFDVSQIHFSGYKRSFFSLLSGTLALPDVQMFLSCVLSILSIHFSHCVKW